MTNVVQLNDTDSLETTLINETPSTTTSWEAANLSGLVRHRADTRNNFYSQFKFAWEKSRAGKNVFSYYPSTAFPQSQQTFYKWCGVGLPKRDSQREVILIYLIY